MGDRLLKWPPGAGSPPPTAQFEEGIWQDYPCIVSHVEQMPGGPAPHFVVDWTIEYGEDNKYPFLPSEVPDFLKNIWFDNAEANRKHVKKSIAELKDRHWGLPVYVVGTGPSLEKNMHELRNVKDGIIIATNNAINILPEDVKIDYYCVVDGRLPERWWKDCKRDLSKIKVISVPLVTTKLCEYFDPDNIYWSRFAGKTGPNKCFEQYDDLNDAVLEPGYVVGFTSTNAAFWLGGNPIVYVGMDCCFVDGFLHAGDTSKAHTVPGEQYACVTDIYGTPRATSSTYLRGMWKLAAASKMMAKYKTFINATEGGCLNQFVSIVPLHEVVSWEKRGLELKD